MTTAMNKLVGLVAFPFVMACAIGSSGYPTPKSDAGITDAAIKDGSPPKDVGGNCKTAPPSNVCGVSPQCGCGSNETCYVTDATGTVACIGAGSKPMGSSCKSTSECALGLTCELSACHAFCNQGSCTDPKTTSCVDLQDGNGGTVPNDSICRIKCSLDSPSTACGTGNCTPINNGAETDCIGAGTSTTCSTSNPWSCQQGAVCLTDNTCHKWCKVGTSCPSGSCQALNPSINVDGVDYGVCP